MLVKLFGLESEWAFQFRRSSVIAPFPWQIEGLYSKSLAFGSGEIKHHHRLDLSESHNERRRKTLMVHRLKHNVECQTVLHKKVGAVDESPPLSKPVRGVLPPIRQNALTLSVNC